MWCGGNAKSALSTSFSTSFGWNVLKPWRVLKMCREILLNASIWTSGVGKGEELVCLSSSKVPSCSAKVETRTYISPIISKPPYRYSFVSTSQNGFSEIKIWNRSRKEAVLQASVLLVWTLTTDMALKPTVLMIPWALDLTYCGCNRLPSHQRWGKFATTHQHLAIRPSVIS